MSMRVVAPGARQIADGVWWTQLPPHEVRMFAQNGISQGEKSVIILSNFEYDAGQSTMTFRLADAKALNVGTTEATILISGEAQPLLEAGGVQSKKSSSGIRAPGDVEFLDLIKAQCKGLQKVADALLDGVRSRFAGELKRGKSRNFSETPDNFWYVIVQTRIEELSITVRGPVAHFDGLTKLEVKDDRGNTRFKVRSLSDVDDALKLIFHAKRKS